MSKTNGSFCPSLASCFPVVMRCNFSMLMSMTIEYEPQLLEALPTLGESKLDSHGSFLDWRGSIRSFAKHFFEFSLVSLCCHAEKFR